MRGPPDTSRAPFPDIPHILLFRCQCARVGRVVRARAIPDPRRPRGETTILSAEETCDTTRRDRQPIRPRTRGLSRWHQKSEYETRRKLHDVIIVLWECLEWSEYHNTPVLHTMGTIVTDFTVYYCSCPAVNSHVAFTCPRGAKLLLAVSHSVGTPRSSSPRREEMRGREGAHIRSFSSPVVAMHFLQGALLCGVVRVSSGFRQFLRQIATRVRGGRERKGNKER